MTPSLSVPTILVNQKANDRPHADTADEPNEECDNPAIVHCRFLPSCWASGSSQAFAIQIRAQLFSWNAGDAFDLDYPFGRYPLPFHDRSAREAEAVSHLGTQTTLRSEQGHTIGHDLAYHREAVIVSPPGKLESFPQVDSHGGTLAGMKIGDRIRQARQAAGLNQRELAAAVGVSHGIVGQWESHRKNPGSTNLLKIAEVTLVDPAALTRDMPGVDGVLVKDTRQITMLRRFVLLSPRQQENLLELLGMAANVRSSAEESCHTPQSEIPTKHRGRTQPR